MSYYSGARISNTGLVFYCDLNNPKSFTGQPTTNYVPYPYASYNGSGFVLGYNYPNPGATYTFDTTVSTPIGDYSGVMKYYTGTTGYKYFSINITGLNSGTYAFSYYAKAAPPGFIGLQQYWRDTGVDRGVSGDWNPTYTVDWKRFVTIGPIDTNGPTGNYLDYFPVHGESIVGGVNVYFWGFQLEKLSYATPFVSGSRSNTQGLLDLNNNTTFDLTNVIFDSNAQPIFDDTNSYITAYSIPDSFWNAGSWSVCAWVKFTAVGKVSGLDNPIFSHGYANTSTGLHLSERSSHVYFGFYNNDIGGTIPLTAGHWYNIVCYNASKGRYKV